MKIFTVIPAWKEEKNIEKTVKSAKKYSKVVVVDDGSSDHTYEMAKKSGAIVERNKKNQGAGAATKKGIKKALDLGADIIVTMDADGQHKSEDIPRLINPIKDGKADFVLGSRFKRKDNMPLTKRFGNKILTSWTKLLFGVSVTDSQSGFKAMKREVALKIKITIDRYGFCSQIIGEVKKKGFRFIEVPIESIYFEHKKGTGIIDGIRIAFDMLKSKWSK